MRHFVKALFSLAIYAGLAMATGGLVAADRTPSSIAESWNTPHGIELVPSPRTIHKWRMLPLLVHEADIVAKQLGLLEEIPIVKENLIEIFVNPEHMAREGTGIGTVSTTNYVYSVARGNKFCYLIGTRQLEDCLAWEKEYVWPISRLDTNAAYALATQWLAAVSMDVEALNRDHHLRIEPDKIYVRVPEGYFVPAYWVGWYKRYKPNPNIIVSNPGEWESVASVFLFLPTKKLLQLRVEDPKYNLRSVLDLQRADVSSPRTNPDATTNAPPNGPVKETSQSFGEGDPKEFDFDPDQ